MAFKHIRRYSSLLVIREIMIKTTIRCFPSTRWTTFKKFANKPLAQDCREPRRTYNSYDRPFGKNWPGFKSYHCECILGKVTCARFKLSRSPNCIKLSEARYTPSIFQVLGMCSWEPHETQGYSFYSHFRRERETQRGWVTRPSSRC